MLCSLRAVLAMLFFFFISVFLISGLAEAEPFPVTRLDISSAISPAQDELLADAVRYAKDHRSRMLLIVLDTPGGLGESMRSMVSTLLNSPIPVAVWVGPPGARAASAGVFLVAASSVAGMAPQTTIGAASPVGLGGEEISKTMAKKVQNDFTSLVKSVAQAHGRNAQWYGESVTNSVSISALEAFELKVIEHVADSADQFLIQAGKSGVLFKGKTVSFAEADLVVSLYEPGFRYEFLSWLLHPQISYLLLMGGMLGLFIELTHPGVILPGVLGGLCLLLGLYAMSVLPTNIAGLLLIGFSLILFILEIKVTSFGMLAIAASASLFIGSIILFRDEYGSIQVPLSFVAWPVVLMTLTVGGVLFVVVRANRQKRELGELGMVGLVGEVLNWKGETGQILVRGEIWAAKGDKSDFTLQRGSRVTIVSINGLTLKIEPVSR